MLKSNENITIQIKKIIQSTQNYIILHKQKHKI